MSAGRRGFTIVELLIVIVIIAILSAITIVAFNGIQQRAGIAAAQADANAISKKVELYKADYDKYPTSITDCPTPAAANICFTSSGSATYVYTKASSYAATNSPAWGVAVLGSTQGYVSSGGVYAGNNEFINTIDVAPIFDKYGLRKYRLEFDIKSADTSSKNVVNVYQQNGSSARYAGPNTYVTVTTTWTHQVIDFAPTLNSSLTAQSMLAFYGTYGTGNIPSIQNIRLYALN